MISLYLSVYICFPVQLYEWMYLCILLSGRLNHYKYDVTQNYCSSALDNNPEESGVRVVQALATIIPWCTHFTSRSFHIPTFLLKRSHGDEVVSKYADLTSWKNAVIYLHKDDRSIILTSLLCPLVTGTDFGRDSCIWAALFIRTLLNQTDECWWLCCEIMRDGSDIYIFIYLPMIIKNT